MSTRLRHLRLSPDGTTLVVKSEKGGVDHELALDELLEVRTLCAVPCFCTFVQYQVPFFILLYSTFLVGSSRSRTIPLDPGPFFFCCYFFCMLSMSSSAINRRPPRLLVVFFVIICFQRFLVGVSI